ncbi:hypothetical protein H6G41_09480 [Tolypothrix sp. FACHB-123]|uniref:hypothetical protein n=1 Tax=Tolypothrix sp. FACHB-123 TaxID=2692868 RepID=UPI0016864953|nr:hypothetical protein [Tolypothrix sp. FACHB-123]MBD2354850.1 hypothetical protein [Tolypothrix sp. FACHB-123]
MSPANHKTSPNPELNLLLFSIPQSLLVQLGTASMLMLLTASKVSTTALEAMGQASVELFRGDRLPILDFPEDNELNNS